MNESLMRDLHDTQMEELTNLKSTIAELAKKPTPSPVDIAKVQTMISNIRVPAQDNTEVLRHIRQLSNFCATADKLSSLESLCQGLKAKLENNSNQINGIRQQLKEPMTKRSHHIIDIRTTAGVMAVICMVLVTAAALSAWVCELNTNQRERENDIKYRYIKMTVGTGGDYIEEIEEFVRTNADGKALQTLENKVNAYERAVADKLRAEEQARRRATKAAELNREAAELGRKANELKQK